MDRTSLFGMEMGCCLCFGKAEEYWKLLGWRGCCTGEYEAGSEYRQNRRSLRTFPSFGYYGCLCTPTFWGVTGESAVVDVAVSL